jgi:hypothetical protein
MEDKQNVRLVEDVASETSVMTKDGAEDDDERNGCSIIYQPHTFRPGSVNCQRRSKLLPAYPSVKNDTTHRELLLLPNVANINRDKFEQNSFCGGYGVCPFEFIQHRYVESVDSFMIDLYRDLFIEPSQQWKIHYSLIDYNLSRLRKCMQLYTEQTKEPALLSLNEWPIALEFFLQIDGK